MSISKQYAEVLDALDVMKSSTLPSIDKSYVEDMLSSVYKEIITVGTLSCDTKSVKYTFADNSVLTFNREDLA